MIVKTRLLVTGAAILVAASLADAQTTKAPAPKPAASQPAVGRVPASTGARRAGRAKEDPNKRDADGTTALQWAVYKGDVAEVKRLLRLGANPKLANKYGASPMSLAA